MNNIEHKQDVTKDAEGQSRLTDVLERELLPCPFCGCTDIRLVKHIGAGDRTYHRGEDVFSIGCHECGGSVPNRYIKNLVVEAWNKRSNA